MQHQLLWKEGAPGWEPFDSLPWVHEKNPTLIFYNSLITQNHHGLKIGNENANILYFPKHSSQGRDHWFIKVKQSSIKQSLEVLCTTSYLSHPFTRWTLPTSATISSSVFFEIAIIKNVRSTQQKCRSSSWPLSSSLDIKRKMYAAEEGGRKLPLTCNCEYVGKCTHTTSVLQLSLVFLSAWYLLNLYLVTTIGPWWQCHLRLLGRFGMQLHRLSPRLAKLAV